MKTQQNPTIHLEDYRPPSHRVVETHMDVTLGFDNTLIHTTHKITRSDNSQNQIALDSESMEILSISIDGHILEETHFSLENNRLLIDCDKNEFTLEIVNRISPKSNTALSGLYQSGDMLCTQCEAEGFRRIAPSIDRPDNLAFYTVTLKADKTLFPVLLCNGNKIDEGKCSGDQFDGNGHYTTWHDPFAKPTYLFAIVAGKLECLEDHFVTQSGKRVALKFFARDRDIEKCHHGMTSLKKSMSWDEEVYGREYDLDVFHVVAVGDFNMGAMENKSLNIFNTKYVLADATMATDVDYHNVESVIAHEYFHNWSGNRVTCRDWFQLSLKEGFTVFRDQEFSADMGSSGVNRINDVNVLRNHQFKEDAGPMAHPVRPASYQEINNFYTATVYNKGAEVVRMIRTLIGSERFRQGCDLYFDTHDGQAVTTDDFVAAMESVTGDDFTQFKRWYSQAGTPVVETDSHFDEEKGQFTLVFKQSCPATPGQTEKQPFVIPIAISLFDEDGNKADLGDGDHEKTLILKEAEQRFVFDNLSHCPTPSILRRFSAPIDLKQNLSNDQLVFLLTHDDDPFNQWEAGQKLFLKQLLENVVEHQSNQPLTINQRLVDTFCELLSNENIDEATLATILTPPSESYVSEQLQEIDPTAVSIAKTHLTTSLAKSAKDLLLYRYQKSSDLNTGSVDATEVAARALRDTCLRYLASLSTPDIDRLVFSQLNDAKCMTDSSSALSALASMDSEESETQLALFYETYKDEPLVIDKWLRAQACSSRNDTVEIMRRLTQHSGFDPTNPNKVYSLILGFTHANPAQFHKEDGSGYDFLVEWVEKIDAVNPQVAARLGSGLNSWQKYTPALQAKMKQALTAITDIPNLSKDVSEIVDKALNN